MKKQFHKSIDHTTAELLGAGSAIAQYIPVVNKKVGSSNRANYVAARWRHARNNNPNEIDWLSIDGDTSSSKVPAKFSRLAVLTTDRDRVNEILEVHGGVQAVAYRLGSYAVMVGTAGQESMFAVNPDDESQYVIGMRIGHGVLNASIGVFSENNNFIQTSHTYLGWHEEQLSTSTVPFV